MRDKGQRAALWRWQGNDSDNRRRMCDALNNLYATMQFVKLAFDGNQLFTDVNCSRFCEPRGDRLLNGRTTSPAPLMCLNKLTAKRSVTFSSSAKVNDDRSRWRNTTWRYRARSSRELGRNPKQTRRTVVVIQLHDDCVTVSLALDLGLTNFD